MVGNVQKAFPACVRSVKRGDVYYADFGSVKDAVGHELAKKRPVLIIQNNLGNVGSTVMEQVDRALLISLGIKGTDLSVVEVEESEAVTEPQETLSIFQSMGQQLRFWQDIEVKVSLIKNEISRLDEEINSILNYIEETTYNAAQGYKVYKVLRDKQVERKSLKSVSNKGNR